MPEMNSLEYLAKKEAELRKVLEKEKEILLLERVHKPQTVDRIMGFQYDEIDTLSETDLEKFLGGLSQYHIFMVKYINQLSIATTVVSGVYERLMNLEIFALPEEFKTKTLKEKERKASQARHLEDVEGKLEELNARLALYKNIPETILNLTQTVKKVYDARKAERKMPA